MLSSDGLEYELLGPLYSDLFFKDKLSMNDVGVKIKLTCSKDSFCLMSLLASNPASWLLCCLVICEKGWVVLGACLAHAEALLNSQY